jgi:outer membrane lipoprotein SlyB
MTRPTLVLLAALTFAACTAPDVNRSAVNFNESRFSADLDHCRGGNIAEASLKTLGKGAVGSLVGAGIVALHGAAAAGSGEAIVVGAAVGAVIGLGFGAHQAIEDHEQEIADCLREKGYEVVAAAD